MSVYIILEAGVNHNGSLDLAKKLCLAAKAAGANCVKFQTFVSENLVSKFAPKAEYQKKSTSDGSQLDMLKKLELSFDDFKELSELCRDIGIDFISTPFDFESIEFLKQLDMPFWKIPSGEVTNLPYLIKIAETQLPVVMSTGMCEPEEINAAIEVLRQNGATDISLLHCNTEYPTPFEDVNLRAMNTLKKLFGVRVGYSDHTKGIEVPVAATALGAEIIEKHFTLDKGLEGPDHKASLDPQEAAAMVTAIRNTEAALGKQQKAPSPSETKNKPVARKSIVAKHPIKKGEILSVENLTVKRPGNGISPMKWFEVLGQTARKDFDEDELIEL